MVEPFDLLSCPRCGLELPPPTIAHCPRCIAISHLAVELQPTTALLATRMERAAKNLVTS